MVRPAVPATLAGQHTAVGRKRCCKHLTVADEIVLECCPLDIPHFEPAGPVTGSPPSFNAIEDICKLSERLAANSQQVAVG